MTSALSIRAHEADFLVNGVNVLYLKGSDLFINNGTSETKIESGRDGKSAFEVWKEQQPEGQYSIVDYLAAIKGESGTNGTNGTNGKSAFEVWCDTQPARTEPYTVADYLAAIKGESGTNGKDGKDGADGTNGTNGADGKSAFECWCDEQPIRYEQDGCTLKPYTFAEYQAAITGPQGVQGPIGPQGPAGPKGDDSSTNWLDWLNTALNTGDVAGIAALQAEVSALQTALAAVQTQIAGLLGTYAVSNTLDNVMDVADELSDFSDVAVEGRGLMDSLSDWFSSFRSRIAGQTTRYNQLTNDYTSPALSSVSNESQLYLLGTGETL